jgi:hypothetical protein
MYYKPSNVPFGLPWRQPTNLLVKVASEAPSPQEVALPKDTETTETMARTLEATGNYKILRRLVPRTAEPRSATDRIGLIIDLETTGLDTGAYRKSSPSVLVMQSTQDRTGQNASRHLGGT